VRQVDYLLESQILCSITFTSDNRAIYEVMWKNIVLPDRPYVTTWRMRISCWIHKATDTHSEYVLILIAFPLQQWLHERA